MYPAVGDLDAGLAVNFDRLEDRTESQTEYFVGGGSVPENCDYTILNQETYTPDGLGRQTTGSFLNQVLLNDATCQGVQAKGSLTRQYDAQDHLVSWNTPNNWPSTYWAVQCAGPPTTPGFLSKLTVSYTWGPNGHPIIMGNTTPQDVLHWDGDQLLFTTYVVNGQPVVDDVKIGSEGEFTPSNGLNGLFVEDRDWTGGTVLIHGANGVYTEWEPANPYHQGCYPADAPPDSLGRSGSSGYSPRVAAEIETSSQDVLFDGVNYIEGARDYDPQLGQWTSTDSSSGIPGNPLSQEPYVWNANNPLKFSDPSGNDPILIGFALPAGGLPQLKPLNEIGSVTATIGNWWADIFAIPALAVPEVDVVLGEELIGGAIEAAEDAKAAEEGVKLTQEGIDAVSSHLSQFDEFAPNTQMVQRLQSAFDAGQNATGADANFFLHETSEANFMSQGLDYDAAHAASLELHGASPFSLYAPEVIDANPSLFNNAWRQAAGLAPRQ
jgi:RHS repeat-associated protein